MSHELRTPLNAIIGFSDIIKSEKFGPIGKAKYQDYANDIHDSGQHLLALINEILDLSKIESGSEDLQEENLEVPAIVNTILTLVRERAATESIELDVELQNGLPALYADERKLKQILVNLLANSIKFTEAGGNVTLKVWCRDDSGFVFQIRDSGIGIALEDIPKAMTPFGQIDSNLNRKFAGTGLGLPLTKHLIEMHSGSLDLQSEVGIGTTATVRLPAERIVPVPPARNRETG